MMPEITDPEKLLVIHLISFISAVCFSQDPKLSILLGIEVARLLIQNGNCQDSTYVYQFLAFIYCGPLGDVETGYQFSDLSLKLVEKRNERDAGVRTAFFVYGFTHIWKHRLHESLAPLADNFEKGLQSGELMYAGRIAALFSFYSFYSGIPLDQLIPKVRKYRIRLRNENQIQVFYGVSIFHQMMLNLAQEREDPILLVGESFDELEDKNIFLINVEMIVLFALGLSKLTLSYLFGKYSEALIQVKECQKYTNAISAFYLAVVLNFFNSLSLLGSYPSATRKKQRKILKIVRANQKKMAYWAKHCPESNEHKYQLVEAELAAKVFMKREQAIQHYEFAIAGAQKNGFLMDQAIATELVSNFYSTQAAEKLAKFFLEEAIYCYRLWGALAKVAELEKRFSMVLKHPAVGYKRDSVKENSGIRSTHSKSLRELDIANFQKSMLVVSSTLVLQDLLKDLTQLAVENSGAQRCVLALLKDGRYVIEAEKKAEKREAVILNSVEIKDDNLPSSLINYVVHSKQPIIENNASQSEKYVTVPYIMQNHTKSILCIPLINQQCVTGILYLENNLMEGVFTSARSEPLILLSSEIAMSIKNAQLYENIKIWNAQLIKMNEAYRRFVPAELLPYLKRNSILEINSGDCVQNEMSVIFADIRDFTALSETMSPKETFDFLNSVMGCFGPVIQKHNGFIDKYVGDAIIALFPTADDALMCALDIQDTLKVYNKERETSFQIGIGINSGSLIQGIVGGVDRIYATVISDVVNIASQVQELTKIHKQPVLLTEQTFTKIKNPERYSFDLIDEHVLLRGKSIPIAVYKITE